MERIKVYLIVTIFSLIGISCSEDPIDENTVNVGILTGKVVEDGTNIPLENVKISTNPASSTVFTDLDGNFIIEEILVDQYSVQAELDGYLAAFESAEINTGITTNVIFEMRVESANNRPPTTPVLIAPEDNSTDMDLLVELVWSSNDPEDDEITYTVELRNDFDDELLTFETVNDTSLVVSDLRFGLKYFWQVGAKDTVNENVIQSEVSVFQTIEAPDNRFLFTRIIESNYVIFSADDAGNELQLTNENSNNYRPRRNVAANRIAYLSNVGSETHIFTMKLDGSSVQQITSAVPVNGFKLEALDFAWSANGGQLYYSNFDKLYAINSDGTNLQEIYRTDDGSFISEVMVSADESLIVLKTNDVEGYNVSVFTIDASGVLVDTILSDVTGAAGGLDISVDNSKVLYWYDASGFESSNYRQLDSRVYLYDRGTAELTDLSEEKPNGTNDYDCKFSPNEAQVIITNTSNDGLSQKNVVLVDRQNNNNGDNRTQILENAEMPDYQ